MKISPLHPHNYIHIMNGYKVYLWEKVKNCIHTQQIRVVIRVIHAVIGYQLFISGILPHIARGR